MTATDPTPNDDPRAAERGFTLIELLVAFLVFVLAISALVEPTSQTLRFMARTRTDLDAIQLAELKMSQILSAAAGGTLPEFGSEQGTLGSDEGGSGGYAFVVEVTPFPVPVPRGTPPDRIAGLGLFAAGGRGSGGPEPAVRRVELRVFPEGQQPEGALALVAFVTEPAEPPAGLAGTPGGAQGEDDDGQGASNPRDASGSDESDGAP